MVYDSSLRSASDEMVRRKVRSTLMLRRLITQVCVTFIGILMFASITMNEEMSAKITLAGLSLVFGALATGLLRLAVQSQLDEWECENEKRIDRILDPSKSNRGWPIA